MLEEKQIMLHENIRDEIVKKNEKVLDEIKIIPLFPNEMFVGVNQAARYYNVPYESIKGVVRRHRKELSKDGLSVISGAELNGYRLLNAIDPDTNKSYIGAKGRAFTVIPRKALLRIGMLLTKSDIAIQLRTYLLNLEKNSTQIKKIEAIKEIELVNDNAHGIQLQSNKYQEQLEKQEFSAKEELININKLIRKLSVFGIPQNEAALLIQRTSIKGVDPEQAIYDKILELKHLEDDRNRGIIRLKINKIAVDYYNEDIPKVYHILSEKMKYIIGIDMAAIRRREKKKYGEHSPKVKSYLDMIHDNKAVKEVQLILDIMVEEAIMEKEGK